MGAQFLTAIGAFLGTIIGITIQELSSSSSSSTSSSSDTSTGLGANAVVMSRTSGLAGTSLQWGDMLLPFTAGTFLYVATVSVIPELLETEKGGGKMKEVKKMAMQFVALALGAGIMLA